MNDVGGPSTGAAKVSAGDSGAGDSGAGVTSGGAASTPTGRATAHGHHTRLRIWARLGLRARVTVMFGAGALLLSASMGGLSYFSARHFLVGERESAALHQAYSNASLIRTDLQLGPSHADSTVSSVNAGSGSESILFYKGQSYGSSLSVNERSIPQALRNLVKSGTPAVQTFDYNGSAKIVVGVPIRSVDAAYFEVFDVSDLAHTLRVLILALGAAGLVTTLLGAALGRSASGRSLRPLSGVSRAAAAIAGGRLDTRLPDATSDPDLEGLTGSFNLMVDQLQERIEREERFTSDVSHELRSPLTTLSASLTVLEDSTENLSPRAREALELLGDDLRRFQRMVGDLLEISRSDSGSADLFREEVSIGELLRHSVAAGSRARPAQTGLPAVVIDPPIASLRLDVDKRRFERIMTNLLENAALYGHGATRVTAQLGPAGADGRPSIRVAVEDAGPGLAPAERLKVFERFYRGHTSGRRGTGTGTGLGLALVAEHVRLHGGTVWVEDVDGGGARFVVELPVENGPSPW